MVAEQDRYFDARVSILKVHDGTALRDLSPYLIELKGLPGQYKVNDSTTYGSLGERPAPSIFVVHFTAEFLFNMITTLGVNTVLATMFATKALRAFEYYPAGEATGNAKWSGSAYLPVYESAGKAGDYVQMHAEFHADNGITIA